MTQILPFNEQVDIEVEFDLDTHPQVEQGAKIAVSLDDPTKGSAMLLTDNSPRGFPMVRVLGDKANQAVGTANLKVDATLADGKVLSQTLGFNFVTPDADAITLNVGTPVLQP